MGDGNDRLRPNGAAAVLERAAEDTLLPFSLPGRNARGRVARLGPALATILGAHAYPAPLARLLGEALVLTALLGAMLRDDAGQLTLQVQAKGAVVDLIVCHWVSSERGGELHGYLRHDAERLSFLGKAPSLKALLGRGHLAITLDQTAVAERYQGIVPLEGASLAEMAERYFAQSEQLPTLIRIAVDGAPENPGAAGGLIVQHVPRGELGRERLSVADEHPDWAHVRALASTMKSEELLDAGLQLETLVWRLFNEDEVRAGAAVHIEQGCRCSEAHFASVLARFPEDERAEMRGEDGTVTVDCAFCAQSFKVSV